MPHTPSAKKNLRKNLKRRSRNRSAKHDIKVQIKLLTSAKDVPADQLMNDFKLATKRLDKAAAKGIIHRNLAARKKSQLAKLLNRKSSPSGK